MSFSIILTLLLVGLIGGFLSSAPIGPINLLLADSVIASRALHRKAFLTGVILVDLLFAALAFWGYHQYMEGPLLGKWVPLAGGLFVVVLGGLGLSASLRVDEKEEKGEKRRKGGGDLWKDLLQGLFLCGSNPAFLLFWVYVVSWLSWYGVEEGAGASVFLLLGITFGDLLWFGSYIHILGRGADRLKGGRLRSFRGVLSFLLILLGTIGILMSNT